MTKHVYFFGCTKWKWITERFEIENDYIHNNGAMPSKILSTKLVCPQIIPATDSDNPESVWL